MNDFTTMAGGRVGMAMPLAADWGVQKLYRYKAKTPGGSWVHDGDTFTVLTDVGFGAEFRMILRPWGYDAPEMKTPEGKAARQYLADLFESLMGPADKHWPFAWTPLYIETIKKLDGDDRQSFGRYLCHVAFEDAQGQLVDLAQHMIDAGHGIRRTS